MAKANSIQRHHRFQDHTGKVFGQLTVVAFAGMTGVGHRSQSTWLCRCKCGVQKIITRNGLTSTISCGCVNHCNRSHGMSRTAEYRTWVSIRTRCLNRQSRDYKNYGGRGITIAPRWSGPDGFINFFADMGERPPGHSIERKNNDGPYSPDNCIWATLKQQNRNTRGNRLLTHAGLTMTVSQWADRTGIDRRNLSQRLNKLGWTIERALTTP